MLYEPVHHVYCIDTNKVIAHNLTLDELEIKIKEGVIDHEVDDIVRVEVENYEEASF